MDNAGYLWVDEGDRLQPHPTGKVWQLSSLRADSTLVALLLARVFIIVLSGGRNAA
jgi:hypothetical protein